MNPAPLQTKSATPTSPVLQRRARGPMADEVPASVYETLRTSGQPLDAPLREGFRPQYGFDLSQVRVHTGPQAENSAREVNAQAYTVGRQIVFGAGQFQPATVEGRKLLAHELTHVGQQSSLSGSPSGISLQHPDHPQESEGVRAENSTSPTTASAGTPVLQRRVAMRDVGRGEQSGFARLPELIARLNGSSTGLIFAMDGENLTYEVKAGGSLSGFDRQMVALIDAEPVIPVRLTNRHGLLGNRTAGFHRQVVGDDYTSGYTDIDDLLGGTDLSMQMILVHFLTERRVTRNYARRIGSPTFTRAEFNRAHNAGIQAEIGILQDMFSDPTIRLVADGPSAKVIRTYRSGTGVRFRWRFTQGRGEERGVLNSFLQVVARDGQVHTPEEYLAILEAERAAAPAPPAPAAP